MSIQGHRLEYQSWVPSNAPDAPAILLLHEGLGSVSLWRTFPSDLAERTGHRVFAYSRLGYGESDAVRLPRPTTFMHDEALEVLPDVLDALALTRPVLFGHSDGGSIALIYAAHHPGRVRGLVLEAPHVFVEDLSITSIARAKVAYETTDLRAKLARFHGDNVDVAFRGWNDVWLSSAFATWNIEALLPRIHCPTLVMQSEDDEYGTLAQLDAITNGIGGASETLILPDGGHTPHHRHRKPVLDVVDRFLSRLPI